MSFFEKPNQMPPRKILITSPSLDPNINVSGVSSVTNFIVESNKYDKYFHVELGKKDNKSRGIFWLMSILFSYVKYIFLIIFKVDLTHFNFALSKPSILRDTPLIFISRLLGKKLIIHLHGGEYLQRIDVEPLLNRLINYVLNGVEPKIVLSSLEKSILIEKYNAPNIYVLPNCVDLSEAQEFKRQTFEQSPLRILFMGRLNKSKGLMDIFDAIKILVKRNESIIFECAGNGEEIDRFVPSMNEILGHNFIYHGVVKGQSKLDLIKKSSVFLLPSIYGEGLPMALLEAMSFGTVPITTNDGSMSYTVIDNENGFIIRKNAPVELANAISKLNQNRCLLKQFSINSRNFIFSNYNPVVYIAQLRNIYESNFD